MARCMEALITKIEVEDVEALLATTSLSFEYELRMNQAAPTPLLCRERVLMQLPGSVPFVLGADSLAQPDSVADGAVGTRRRRDDQIRASLLRIII